jgi:hypothetical protein
MGRIIGIRHRVKKTAEGESSPTMIHVLEDGKKGKTFELKEETDELDWVLGLYPTAYQPVIPGTSLEGVQHHHIKWKKIPKDEVSQHDPAHVRQFDKDWKVAKSIPLEFDGLRTGDTVSMVLGGSGDVLAYAISRQCQKVKARIVRVPPFHLKRHRPDEKQDDSSNLAQLAQTMPELFYAVEPRDEALILVRECWRNLQDAMKARIACEQRLRQHLIGQIFTRENMSPEGDIEREFDLKKANDKIYQALLAEEKERDKNLQKAVSKLPVYQEVLNPVKGVGPRLAARIVSAIIDIRRFETAPQLKAFMGVHVMPDGRQPRRRKGAVSNWHPDGRQGVYLLCSDQFVKQAQSPWGLKLRENKAYYRARHPEIVVKDNGKKAYTDGHIHKMAIWKTAGEFVEWLHTEWWKLEKTAMKPAA